MNVVNTMPYLRTTRDFPLEPEQMQTELSRSYLDIAASVNDRTIGIFPVNRPAITGEAWYLLKNRKQQSLRQVYTFTSTSDIDLGFKLATIERVSNAHGSYLSGSSYYGLIYATNVPIAGQITFWFEVNAGSTTTDLLRFSVGGGAPALTSGTIVLEWLSQV